MRFLERTFQLSKGIGPWRERDLWARNVATWTDFEKAAQRGTVMAKRLDHELLVAIERARDALARSSLVDLAGLVPAREHWRLYGHFTSSAAFFDIEADGDRAPTIVGVMDQAGVATFRRDLNLEKAAPRLASSPIWVTFNGSVFDVPVLQKAFEGFPKPVVHLDLRFLIRHAKLKGGLKGVEDSIGIGRPQHLRGLNGLEAISLWRTWEEQGDLKALRLLVEYNLYDAVNLRCVLEWTLYRMAQLQQWGLPHCTIFERGDVLYDVSQLVLAQSTTTTDVSRSRSS